MFQYCYWNDVIPTRTIVSLAGLALGLPGDPVFAEEPRPFTTLQTSAGSWDRYRTALDVNTPIDEQGDVLSRINLAVEDNHSFRDHVDSKRAFVAPSLSWQLSPDTGLLVESEFVRHSST